MFLIETVQLFRKTEGSEKNKGSENTKIKIKTKVQKKKQRFQRLKPMHVCHDPPLNSPNRGHVRPNSCSPSRACAKCLYSIASG